MDGFLSHSRSLEEPDKDGPYLLIYVLAVETLDTDIRSDPLIHGLISGSLVEKISMYAEDTLLYLEDLGFSLSMTLQLIEQSGPFSGLKINWEKSQILPIDTFPPPRDQSNLSLQRVNNIKYLNIYVTNSSADYISANLELLFDLIRSKTQIWTHLPVGVMGCVNLI